MATARAQARARRKWHGFLTLLGVLTLFLSGCGTGATNTDAGIPAAPTLTPFPVIATNAPLREQLHLRTVQPEALSLIVQPDDGRAPIVNALNSAQTSIDLEIYLLTDREVINALETAVNRGVTVRVMMEPNPCCADTNAMQRSIYAELQEARVQVQWTNPAFRLTHAKLMIVDGSAAFVMSQNLTKSSFFFNREATIVTRDGVDVNAAQAIFDADWNRTTLTPSDPDFLVANLNARTKLLALIRGATKSLVIESEEMQDPEIIDALIAAERRGVSVRYIGSTAPAGSPATSPDANAPGRKHLAMNGVSVKILAAPYVHTKTIIADDTVAYVGSVNFSASSLNDNREVGIFIESKPILTRLDGVFTKDWASAKAG